MSIALCFLAGSALVYAGRTFTDGCFTYRVDDYVHNGDSTVSIIGAADSLLAATALELPGKVVHQGYAYRVTAVGENAFAGNGCVERVVVGEGIEAVYNFAFQGCCRLRDLEISCTVDDVSHLAFGGCPGLSSIHVDGRNKTYDSREGCNALIHKGHKELVLGCQASVIPNGIERIGNHAFDGCTGLEHLAIPEGVAELGCGALANCANLESVVLPQSLEKIEELAFSGCSKLKSLHIPRRVSSIQAPLFVNCWMMDSIEVDALNRVYDSREDCNAIVETATGKLVAGCGNSRIVEGIKEIGEAAFIHSALREVEIPKTVAFIGERAFSSCVFCTSMAVDAQNPVYDSREGCNAIVETATGKLVAGCAKTVFADGVKEIGAYAFSGLYLPPTLVLPGTVRKVGTAAFMHSEGIGRIFLPPSIVEMGTSAFYSSSLRQVYWDASVGEIPESTFSNCKDLYVVDFPKGIKAIGENAFKHCASLSRVRLPDGVEYIGYDAFAGSPCEKEVMEKHSSALSSDYGQPQRGARR